MTQTSDSTPALSVVRICLRRRGSRPGHGFWGRPFGRSLSYDLAERVLEAGVSYATVTSGHAGFVPGAKRIVADVSEIPPTTLPTCLELVGPVGVLEAFVDAKCDELADAVLLRIDGINVSRRGIPA